jgi:hypothetical protein
MRRARIMRSSHQAATEDTSWKDMEGAEDRRARELHDHGEAGAGSPDEASARIRPRVACSCDGDSEIYGIKREDLSIIQKKNN